MPERYEAIKQSLLARARKKGQPMDLADAKTSAAKIFNATRKPNVAPVTRYSDAKAKPKKKRARAAKPPMMMGLEHGRR